MRADADRGKPGQAEPLHAEFASDSEVMSRLHQLSTRLIGTGELNSLLGEIIEAALDLTGAYKGNIQLFRDGALRIIEQRGFDQEFLDFFNNVDHGQAACGTALDRGERVIVEDVANSPVFLGSPSLEAMVRAGALAVQSTPLFTRAGTLLGMFSTHYAMPQRPSERDLRMIDLLVRQAADLIERSLAEEKMAKNVAALTRMHELSNRTVGAEGLGPIVQEIMSAAVSIVGAQRGTLQLLEQGSLRIIAHHGHEKPFLDHFSYAESVESVCGEAMKRHERVLIPDITTSPLFEGSASLSVLLAAGVRAVQSTPLFSRTDSLLGILTTQWSTPHTPDETDLWRLDLLARQASDLIERAQAEEALRESEERLRQFVERSPYAVAMLDRELRYLFASQKWLSDFKLTSSDIRAKSHYELFPEIPMRWKEVHRRCLNGEAEKNDGEVFARADGSIEWIRWEVRPWFDNHGKVGGLLMFSENITGRIKSEAQLQLIANTLPAFVTYVDREERYRFVNDAYLQWIGKRREEVLGQSAEEILGDEVYTQARAYIRRALNGEPVSYDLPWRNSMGEERVVRIDYTPDVTPEGAVNGYVMHGQDVTDLRRAISARDEFLSIASHELRTPLTSLKLQAQMRKRNIKSGVWSAFSPEKLPKLIDDDERQIARLTRLVEDMLDVSRIASGKFPLTPEEFDLAEVVRDILERFSPQLLQSGIEVHLDAPREIRGIWDRYRIEQIVTNLLTNAIKYGDKKPIYVGISSAGGTVRVMVRDRGIGIAEKDLARIFQLFERAASSSVATGLGLGLYIAKQLVDAHSGKIQVHSQLGQGSTFTVELPQDALWKMRETLESPLSRNIETSAASYE